MALADSIDDNLKLDIEGSLTEHIKGAWLNVGVRVKNVSEVNYEFVQVECTGFRGKSAILQDSGMVHRVKRFSTAYGQVMMPLTENVPPPDDVKCRILDAHKGKP